jgi:hypothetical protein
MLPLGRKSLWAFLSLTKRDRFLYLMAHILFQRRERKVVMGKHKKIERMKEIDRRRKRREERVKQKAREKRESSQPSRASA